MRIMNAFFIFLLVHALHGSDTVRFLYKQPSVSGFDDEKIHGISDPDNTSHKRNVFNCTSFNLGNLFAHTADWDMGEYTGFTPPGWNKKNNPMQRSILNRDGASGFQAYGNTIALYLNNRTAPADNKAKNPTMRCGFRFEKSDRPFPWKSDNGDDPALVFSYEVKIPLCTYNDEDAAAYAMANFMILDTKNKRLIGFGAHHYHSELHLDERVIKIKSTMKVKAIVKKDFRFYGYIITKEHIKTMAEACNAWCKKKEIDWTYSTDPADYSFNSFNMGIEIFRDKNKDKKLEGYVSMASVIRNIQIYIMEHQAGNR